MTPRHSPSRPPLLPDVRLSVSPFRIPESIHLTGSLVTLTGSSWQFSWSCGPHGSANQDHPAFGSLETESVKVTRPPSDSSVSQDYLFV